MRNRARYLQSVAERTNWQRETVLHPQAASSAGQLSIMSERSSYESKSPTSREDKPGALSVADILAHANASYLLSHVSLQRLLLSPMIHGTLFLCGIERRYGSRPSDVFFSADEMNPPTGLALMRSISGKDPNQNQSAPFVCFLERCIYLVCHCLSNSSVEIN
jgi:hypothetical protein